VRHVLLSGEGLDGRHQAVGEPADVRRLIDVHRDGWSEGDADRVASEKSRAVRAHAVRAHDADRDDRYAGLVRQADCAGAAAVEAAVGGAGALGEDGYQTAGAEYGDGGVERREGCPSATPFDRMAPMPVTTCWVKRPRCPGERKYSALAQNAMCRGVTTPRNNWSATERWLAARIAPPLSGRWPRPVTVGRQEWRRYRPTVCRTSAYNGGVSVMRRVPGVR